ncbi:MULTISPECIES: hypothetical protein [Methanobacterium]|uniref:Uncharacterized protein n=1 Tax=Methanobacterium veterum TaxID=408577 RepID=A0A9E5A4T1_9EURY|nr:MULTISPECIES: hypothetical protein [Methanobacterium]MCZ3364827.1 hypothetical protein [Methanobacterium veterum]MCZ3372581.1 hypothetical protein [Methanobacterium veterum]
MKEIEDLNLFKLKKNKFNTAKLKFGSVLSNKVKKIKKSYSSSSKVIKKVVKS